MSSVRCILIYSPTADDNYLRPEHALVRLDSYIAEAKAFYPKDPIVIGSAHEPVFIRARRYLLEGKFSELTIKIGGNEWLIDPETASMPGVRMEDLPWREYAEVRLLAMARSVVDPAPEN